MHREFTFIGCSETEKEYLKGFDGEEEFHSDFIKKRGVVSLPDFADHIEYPGAYESSVAQIEICKQNLEVDMKVYKPSAEQLGKIYTLCIIITFSHDEYIKYIIIWGLLFGDCAKISAAEITTNIIKSLVFCVFTDPPDTSIYSEDDVVLDVENTLICHVTGFFPPPVNVSWTKNNQIVSEDISLSQYRRKNDGTFNIFSSLKFTPKEGDIYSCTVYHKSIQGQPKTKTWGEELFHVD